jgi:hypothetical protein
MLPAMKMILPRLNAIGLNVNDPVLADLAKLT